MCSHFLFAGQLSSLQKWFIYFYFWLNSGILTLKYSIAERLTIIKIEFTPEEIDALEYERYHHPEPKVQKKMEALYLKS
jgi:hypothetical protein